MWFLKKLFKKRDEQLSEDGDVVKPFLDHLEDLRWTLLKMVATLAMSMIVAFAFRTTITHILNGPLDIAVPGTKLIVTQTIGTISMSFSLAFYAGIIVAFPILFYFLAEFLLPALTKKEKRYVLPAVGVGFGLFLIGVLLCYFFVLPPTLRWLHNDAVALGIESKWTANDYYQFVTHMSIAIGLVCELPVVMVTLSGIGLISYAWLKGMRMYGYAIALVLAGVISPTPDLFMLFIFALPIMVLFEACIWIVWLLEKRRAASEEAQAEHRESERMQVAPATEAVHQDPHQHHYDEQHHYHDEYHDEHHGYDDFHHQDEHHGEALPAPAPEAEKPAAAASDYVPPTYLFLP